MITVSKLSANTYKAVSEAPAGVHNLTELADLYLLFHPSHWENLGVKRVKTQLGVSSEVAQAVIADLQRRGYIIYWNSTTSWSLTDKGCAAHYQIINDYVAKSYSFPFAAREASYQLLTDILRGRYLRAELLSHLQVDSNDANEVARIDRYLSDLIAYGFIKGLSQPRYRSKYNPKPEGIEYEVTALGQRWIQREDPKLKDHGVLRYRANVRGLPSTMEERILDILTRKQQVITALTAPGSSSNKAIAKIFKSEFAGAVGGAG